MAKRSDYHFERILTYLATASSKTSGKSVKEIAEAVELSEASVYRYVRSVRAGTYGIGEAVSPVWPTTYYVGPEVALLATTYKHYRPENKTIAQAVELIGSLLDRTTPENLEKLQKAFDDDAITIEELLVSMTRSANAPNALALQALILLKLCYRKVVS